MSFEKLRVYQAAQELRREVDKLREHLDPRPEFQALFIHVVDAVDSISNNIAEGAESIYPGKQKAYYDIAAGSSKEARSGLRSLSERRAFGAASAFRAIVLSLAISKLLAALIDRLGDHIHPSPIRSSRPSS
jgi:four helix bundle protein